MYGLSNGMIANDLEGHFFLFETFVISITHK